MVGAPAAVFVVGGVCFYLLVVLAVRKIAARPSRPTPAAAVSILKPLSGLELGLEENLRSFFSIEHTDFEILFGVYGLEDPAAAVAQRLIDAHPEVRARLIVAGEPPPTFPNRKVFTLSQLAAEAAGDIFIISDSDIYASPDYADGVVSSFADPQVGVSTCPYRGVGGGSLWSELEAVGMNTELWGGVFVARMLAPMDFAVGPTMAVRRACLEELGGFEAYRDYLAEDFVIGRDAAARGWKVVLAKHVVEHRIGSQDFWPNLQHRLRWYRSTRRSRPAGYALQIFTYPLPFAIAAVALTGGAAWSWGLLGVCLGARALAARATARFLGQQTNARFWALLPLEDLYSFLVWISGFFGNRIVWRTHELRLTRDGRLRPIQRA